MSSISLDPIDSALLGSVRNRTDAYVILRRIAEYAIGVLESERRTTLLECSDELRPEKARFKKDGVDGQPYCTDTASD